MEQQTAVSWLVEQLAENGIIHSSDIHKAKEMEKQQIEDSFNFGVCDGGGIIKKYKMSGEQYYNKTYKQ